MSAIFSPCGSYRYRLEREISETGIVVALLGVNPSKAGVEVNDATIRKDMGFARRLGWRKIIKGNKFACVSTNIRGLQVINEPIGPENDAHLEQIMHDADIVVAAWGPLAKLPTRLRTRFLDIEAIAARVGRPLWCFGTAQDGQPLHTLMLPYETRLRLWRGDEVADLV